MANISKIVAAATDHLSAHHNDARVLIRFGTPGASFYDWLSLCGEKEVAIEFKDDTFNVHVREIIDHFRAGSAWVAETRDLDTIKCGSLEQLGGVVVGALSKYLDPEASLNNSLTYRIDRFAHYEEPFEPKPKGGLLKQVAFGAKAAAPDMWVFVGDCVQETLGWEPLVKSGDSVSMWWTLGDDRYTTLYTTVTRCAGTSLQVEIDDRANSPFKKKSKVVASEEQAIRLISDYMARNCPAAKLKVDFFYRTCIQ